MSSLSERLIETVKLYEILFNTSHPDYKNTRKRDKAWEAIGDLLGSSGPQMKKKWKNLRDSYTKHLRAEKTHTSQDAKYLDRYKSWPWVQQMDYFRQHLQIVETDANICSEIILNDIEVKNEIALKDKYDDEELELDPPRRRRRSRPQQALPQHVSPAGAHKRKPKDTTSTAVEQALPPSRDVTRKRKPSDDISLPIERASNYLRHGQTDRNYIDDIDLICLGYARSIKKLTPRRQTIVKFKFAEILMQEELAQQTEDDHCSVRSSYGSPDITNAPLAPEHPQVNLGDESLENMQDADDDESSTSWFQLSVDNNHISSNMSTKRKRAPVKKGNKRGKRKEESDIDSDMSDQSDIENTTQPDEVLISGHGDVLDEPTKLPEELLKTLIKPAGQLILFGQVNWDTTGRKETKMTKRSHPNLYEPHRFTDLKVRFAASGCVAAHSVLVAEDGRVLTFGRNQFGQLGTDNTTTMDIPTEVAGMKGLNVISAACGRNHTLFLTDTGTVYACGDNRSGQCGVGNNQPQLLSPKRLNYRGAPIIKIGCGADFSIILDIKGGLHSFGLPEFGQLGHNTDGKYFKTSTRLCYHYETSPKRIVLYVEKAKDGHVAPVDVTEIVDFSCGQNHTVAIDSKKRAFSWGFGGFGRLGHADTKDEMVPRLIKYFDSQARGIRSVMCGSSYSLALTDLGALFLFGLTKRTGEANMYPKPVQDLAGWDIHHVTCGFTSIIIAADESVIAWGCSPTYGELGFGDITKSSSVPKEVTRLAGIKVLCLSMGYSHTLIISQDETPEQKEALEKLELFEP